MINRTSNRMARIAAIALVVGFAASGHAGTATVSPALAACSKALVESISSAETLPSYTIKAPSRFTNAIVDLNSFTVLAHSARTNELLAKAACRATPAGDIVSFKALPVKT
jgi:hypothetical protein